MKLVPVTDDYKKAFISAISSHAFSNHQNSQVAQRSVAYFNKMGIQDEKLILDCISNDFFLTEFKNNENEELKLQELVESEIQKYIKKVEREKKSIERDKNILEQQLKLKDTVIIDQEKLKTKEIVELNVKLNDIGKQLVGLNKELDSFKTKQSDYEQRLLQKEKELEIQRDENEKLKNDKLLLESKIIKINFASLWGKLKKHLSLYNLFVFINIIICGFIFISGILVRQIKEYSIIPILGLTMLINKKEIKWYIIIFLLLAAIVFIKVNYVQIWNGYF
jgi:hypothetical protein